MQIDITEQEAALWRVLAGDYIRKLEKQKPASADKILQRDLALKNAEALVAKLQEEGV